MTTPRDPGRPIRGGGSPSGEPGGVGGDAGREPGAAGDERWTPEDRYVVERHRPELNVYDRSGPGYERPEPDERRRRRPMWASAGLAALLAALLILLIVVAVVLPGLGGAAPSASPSASAGASVAVATPSPTPTPSPTRTPRPSPTPLPSVLEVEVQPGDSLTSIAMRYDTKARSIAFWNRDRYPTLDPESEDYNPDQIQVGWKLVVHPGQTFPEPSPSGAPSGAPASGSGVAPSPPAASAAPGG